MTWRLHECDDWHDGHCSMCCRLVGGVFCGRPEEPVPAFDVSTTPAQRADREALTVARERRRAASIQAGRPGWGLPW